MCRYHILYVVYTALARWRGYSTIAIIFCSRVLRIHHTIFMPYNYSNVYVAQINQIKYPFARRVKLSVRKKKINHRKRRRNERWFLLNEMGEIFYTVIVGRRYTCYVSVQVHNDGRHCTNVKALRIVILVRHVLADR